MYADDRHDHPNWKFVGTESAGVGGSRNTYTLPSLPGETAALATGPAGGSGGGRGGASYATSTVRGEALWKFIKAHDYVIGDFMWTGIDYLGETGGTSRGAGSGRIDIAGFPKDGFYFYQSQWTTKPMIHLMPHWNWPAERTGQIIPVIAYTNCDTVELFVNGKSYGRKSIEFPRQGNSGGWNSYARPVIPGGTLDLHMAWDVAYASGTVRAVGYRNHQIVCETEMKTTGDPAAIKLVVDHPTVRADARDVAHFIVTVVDSNGLLVPTANPMISFDLQGPAKIIGTDNGNLNDTSSNVSKDRRAMNGMALVIIQTTREAGKIRLTARPEGIQPVTVEIDSQFVPAGKK
jgi:beta-galactosidase